MQCVGLGVGGRWRVALPCKLPAAFAPPPLPFPGPRCTVRMRCSLLMALSLGPWAEWLLSFCIWLRVAYGGPTPPAPRAAQSAPTSHFSLSPFLSSISLCAFPRAESCPPTALIIPDPGHPHTGFFCRVPVRDGLQTAAFTPQPSASDCPHLKPAGGTIGDRAGPAPDGGGDGIDSSAPVLLRVVAVGGGWVGAAAHMLPPCQPLVRPAKFNAGLCHGWCHSP